MTARAGLAFAALALCACTRSFVSPIASGDGGRAAPRIDALLPPQAFAGATVLLQGENLAADPSADLVRVGTQLAAVVAVDVDGGLLTFVVPPLGDAAQPMQVSVTVGGLPSAPASLGYLGLGHPAGFTMAPVSDLSPAPLSFSANAGFLSVGLAGFPAVGITGAGAQNGLWVANPPLVLPVQERTFLSLTSLDLWVVEQAPPVVFPPPIFVHLGISDGGVGYEQTLGPANITAANQFIPVAGGVFVVGPNAPLGFDGAPWAPGFSVTRFPEPDPVVATVGTTDPGGTLELLAVAVEADGGAGDCLFLHPGLGPCVMRIDGIRRDALGTYQPFSFPAPRLHSLAATVAPDHLVGDVYTQATESGQLVVWSLLPQPAVQTVTGQLSNFLGTVVASDTRLLSLSPLPASAQLYDLGGQPQVSVPLPGLPIGASVDPQFPHHLFVSVGSPPEIVELDDQGVQISQTPLSALVHEVALSPSAAHAVAGTLRIPRVVPLDGETLAVQLDVDAGLLLPILDDVPRHLTWLGESVVCATAEPANGVGPTRVLCGRPDPFPPLRADGGVDSASGCELLGPFDPPPAPAVPAPLRLRADVTDAGLGLAVYTHGNARRFRVQPGEGGAPFSCADDGEALPGAQLATDWTQLSFSDDGQTLVQVTPSVVQLFVPGGSGVLCAVGDLDAGCGTAPDLALLDPTGDVLAMSFNPLVLVSGGVHRADPRSTLALIDLSGDEVLSMAFSADGQEFYVGTGLGRLHAFARADIQGSGEAHLITPRRTLVTGFPVGAITAYPSGGRLLLIDFSSDRLYLVQ